MISIAAGPFANSATAGRITHGGRWIRVDQRFTTESFDSEDKKNVLRTYEDVNVEPNVLQGYVLLPIRHFTLHT